MRSWFSLRVVVPVIILGFGLLVALTIYYLIDRQANRQIEEFARARVLNAGRLTASGIESALRRADLLDARANLVRAAFDPNVREAALLDEDNRIRYSTTFQRVGKYADWTRFGDVQRIFADARANYTPHIVILPGQSTIFLVVPLRLESDPQSLMATRTGLLVMEYDFNSWRRDVRKYALYDGVIVAVLMTLLCAILAVSIHVLVTRRVGKLVRAAGAIADGNYESLELPGGHDEIGALSAATRKMVDRLGFLVANLRHSEQRVRSIMDSAADAILVLLPDGSIESSNARATEMFGYSAEELEAMNFGDIVKLPANITAKDYTERQISADGDRKTHEAAIEIYGRHRDGSTFPLEFAHGKLHAPDGDRIVTVARDTTDRRALENQLHHVQRIEAVGRLTAGIAHDFNNLLAIIMGNLELVQDNPGKDKANKMIATALQAASRGADLTQQLLAFGRRAVLTPEVVDANNVIRDMGELFRRTLPETIQIETVLFGGLWPINIDRPQFESALLNLAINARDAMPDGGKLTIETANIRLDEDYVIDGGVDIEPGRYVMIAVSDTGTGMSEEVAEQAFEPFFTTKSVGKGSGLGLAMVFGFARQSGGNVRIYTEEGVGTTVKLYFPETEKAGGTQRRSAGRRQNSGDERVLVAEDSDDVRAVITAQLQSMGYDVVGARNGDEAIELLRSDTNFDLLLTDVVMPGNLQGPVLANIALKEFPKLKVMFMSGYPKGATESGSDEAKNVPKVTKPIQRVELAQVIRRTLGGD